MPCGSFAVFSPETSALLLSLSFVSVCRYPWLSRPFIMEVLLLCHVRALNLPVDLGHRHVPRSVG